MNGERVDFFVSHAGSDRVWAEWVAWELQDAGYTVELDVWDWAAGRHLIAAISDALDRCDRVVALFSPAYFDRSRYTTEEWSSAVLHVPGVGEGRLVPVRIEQVPSENIPAVLRSLLFQDVFGMAEDQARRALLDAVQGPRRPGAKPVFPGQDLPGALSGTGQDREQFVDAARRRLPAATALPVAGIGEELRAASAVAQSNETAVARARAVLVPWELPGDVADFTGRVAELAELDRMLTTTEMNGRAPRPVVISVVSGTAGVGKTALAVHWAHKVAEFFPDGLLYVNLRGYDPGPPVTAADALAGFLRALGVPGPDIPAETDERATRYRSLVAGRRLLVLLDNACGVEQIRPLLPGTPSVMVLLTSRDSLAGLVAREGARRLNLDLLSPAEAVSLLRALIGERAAADPSTAAVLAELCARLPLALRVAAELAVSRPAVPLADLADELTNQQRRLDLLEAGADPRTAVRAVFSWSHRQLDPGAARTFRLMGLHPGTDLDIHAAAALTGTTVEQAGHALDRLARAHLLQVTRPGRYGMHDLLRAYAAGLAASDERPAPLTRLFDHYLASAAAAMDMLSPSEHHRRPRIPPPVSALPPITNRLQARAWLDAERANLVALATYTTDHGWPSHVIRLAATLFRYLDSGSHYPEATIIHTCAHRAACDAGDRAAEATALTNLGCVDMMQGRYQQATDCLQQAIALCSAIGDQAGEARALVNLGSVNEQQGRYEQATDCLQHALTLYQETGDRIGQARALVSLGGINGRQGRYQLGITQLEQALALFRESGDQTGEALALGNLGDINLRQEDCKRASLHHQQALAIFRETGDRAGEAEALNGLGNVDLRQGRHQEARNHHQQALELFRETGDRVGAAEALIGLGNADLRQGRHQEARNHHQQALELFRETGHRAGAAEVLNSLGEVCLAIGQPSNAVSQHTTALNLASQIGDTYEQARAHHGLAHAHDALGDTNQTQYHRQRALTLHTGLGHPPKAHDALRSFTQLQKPAPQSRKQGPPLSSNTS